MLTSFHPEEAHCKSNLTAEEPLYGFKNSEEKMVIKYQQKTELPKELKKEISVLYDLGLENYEVEYLVYLKRKARAGKKWEEQDSINL